MALIANVHRDRKKRRRPFFPVDFHPHRQRQTSAGLIRVPKKVGFKLLKAAFFGRGRDAQEAQ